MRIYIFITEHVVCTKHFCVGDITQIPPALPTLPPSPTAHHTDTDIDTWFIVKATDPYANGGVGVGGVNI